MYGNSKSKAMETTPGSHPTAASFPLCWNNHSPMTKTHR